jgi:hypothetical protein
MKYAILCTAVVTLAGTAHGAIFSEVENNNTLALANDIGTYGAPGDSILIDGVLGINDVDWFSFTITDDASLSVFSAFGASGDGVMQLVADGGDVIAFDDDSGIDLMPAIQVLNLTAGTYFLGFSGFGDVDGGSVDSDELADGLGHQQNFGYKLTIGFSIIPAPGALALAGMGGIVMTRRRRA